MGGHSYAFPSNVRWEGGDRIIHFLVSLIVDMGKEIVVAVVASLILSAFAKKKNHSSSQDSGSSSDKD